MKPTCSCHKCSEHIICSRECVVHGVLCVLDCAIHSKCTQIPAKAQRGRNRKG